MQGNRAAIGKHGEQSGNVVPYIKSLLSSPHHRPEHGDVEIRINSKPRLDMNNLTLGDY
jgi:hypothetical protein